MDKTKESLGFFINSDGPDGGVYKRARGADFAIKAPPVGTPHFTNWDAGLTSLENTTKERFEARIATRFLDDHMSAIGSDQKIRFGAKDIKIVDNLAAISYPKFTDINKSVAGITGSSILSYMTGEKVNMYDYECISWSEVYIDHMILPQFDLDVLTNPYPGHPSSSNRFDPSFEGMYIVLEYNGNYTKADANPCNPAATYYDSLLDGKRQLLTYNPSFLDLDWGEFTMIDFAPAGNVSQARKVLIAKTGNPTDISPTSFFTGGTGTIGEQVYGFGEIECDVYVVKYKPVIECGKVDLYTKKRGNINSYLSNGRIVSLDHNLKNGDIVKISNAQNSTINGVRYVQVINDSTFILYKNSDFTERENSYYEGSPVWTACGNVYNEESQAWDYLGTVTSPEGRNGYAYERLTTHDIATFYKTDTLGDYFNGVSTTDELLRLDFDISESVFNTYKQFPVVSGVPTRSADNDTYFSSLNFRETELKASDIFSPLDTFWTTSNNYLQSFRFGEGLDLIKYQDRYILVVGEPGLETIPDLSVSLQLPVNPVYGKVFLFDIYMDSNGQITDPSDDPDRPISFNSKYYAHTNDSSIGTPYILTPDDNESGFYRDISGFFGGTTFDYYYSTLTHTTGGLIDSDSTATQKADRFFDYANRDMLIDPDLFRQIEYKTNMEYWYGAMVYHLADILRDGGEDAPPIDTSGLDYTTGGCRDAYFTDLKVPQFLTNSSIVYTQPPTYCHRGGFYTYPYIDEFGKSVAISIDGADIYLFSSSTVKPIVERPDYNGTDLPTVSISLEPVVCTNTEISKTYCGYLHIFKNGTKTQKIYESGESLPSGGWRGQYYKAQKFGVCILTHNDELVFGQSKPIDYHSVASTSIETSKIFIYKRVAGVYVKIKEIQNDNNLTFSFVNTISFPDQKEYFLRDGNEALVIANGSLTGYDLNNKYYHPSDRFGSWFRYNGDILVTNAFDVYNENNEYHGSNNDIYITRSNEFNRPIDYLHVYEKYGNDWVFVRKIAASFDRYDASYDYDSIGVNIYNSIRSIGNINYSNSDSNSRTWDIDLTGCYDLVNDRILLKDPLSYSVFQRSVNQTGNEYSISATLDKYFTYDEKYEAEETLTGSCDLTLDRISAIHKYDNYLDDYRNLYCENKTSTRSINYRTPVYFVNVPINSNNISRISSISVNVEEVRSLDAGVNLKLVLFKKDPRTTVYPFYSSLCSSTPALDAAEKWTTSLPYNDVTFLKGGVFDSSNYADTSSGDIFDPCSGSSCLSALISASSITVSGSRRDYVFTIDNSSIDINNYLNVNNLILDSDNNRTINTEIIEFDDLSNIGYDSGVSVESSLIIGFIYEPMNYKIDSNFGARADVRVVDITLSGFAYIPPTPTSDVDYTYSCVYNKVVSLDYYRTYYNSPVNKMSVSEIDGKMIYINPIITAGLTETSTINNTNSDQNGYSDAYEILSVDNFGTTPETSVFSNLRSLDIQNLETLPMYMQGVEDIPYINLFMKTADGSIGSTNLFLQNTGSSNNLPLYIRPLAQSSGYQDLLIKGANISSGTLPMHTIGGPAGSMYMFMQVPEPQNNNISLYLFGYNAASGNIPMFISTREQSVAPLFVKSRDSESIGNNSNLFIYGNTTSSSFTTNNTPLFMSVFDDARQSIEGLAPLSIFGPNTYIQSGVNSMPLRIGNDNYLASGNLSLFNFGGFGGSPTNNSLNLSIKNTGINSSGNMTLVIPIKGFNNSDTISNEIGLYLKQNQSTGNLPMFITPSTGLNGSLNLFMPTGVGVLNDNITTFIRGFRA